MSTDNIPKLPLGLQMALAHNIPAMQTFLGLEDREQDELIKDLVVLTKGKEPTVSDEIYDIF